MLNNETIKPNTIKQYSVTTAPQEPTSVNASNHNDTEVNNDLDSSESSKLAETDITNKSISNDYCRPVNQLPSYTTVMTHEDNDTSSVLNYFLKNTESATVYLSNIQDLLGHNLIDKTIVGDEETNANRLTQQRGILFDDSIATIVLDFTKIPLEDIAKFNSLFDPPPTMCGKQINNKKKIVSIINPKLFTGSTGLGHDFGRRVFSNKYSIDVANIQDEDSNYPVRNQQIFLGENVDDNKDKLVIDLVFD